MRKLLHSQNLCSVVLFILIDTFILAGNKSISCIKQLVYLLNVTFLNKFLLVTVIT